MPGRNYFAILAALAAMVLGCASAPTHPPDTLPDPDEVGGAVFGGWIEIEYGPKKDKKQVVGELLAVDSVRVYVLREDAMRVVPIDSVREARLTWYDSHGGGVAAAAALGTLTTISNGAFLVFTAPMWMIGGTIAAHSQYHAPVVKTPKTPWEEVRPYARFPQGLPPGFVPSGVTIAETVFEPVVEPEPLPPPLPSRRHTEGGTQWGFAFGFGASRYPGSDDSGLGFVMGVNVGTKWATAGVRMAVSGRDDQNSTAVAEAVGEGTVLDLGLLLGARVGFSRFELAARAGPAVWGFEVGDFIDFKASFAAQGELFVYPWRNVGIGTLVAYNDNDLLDFYIVTLAIAVGPR
jgi:hypothetical protein